MSQSPSTIPVIRLSQVLPFSRWLESVGIPTERSLRAWGLPSAPDEAPDLWIAGGSLWGWIGATARAEGIEDFGVRVGKASRVEDIGALGHSLQAEPTLRDVITKLVSRVNRHSSHAAFGWSEEGSHAWLWRRPTPGSHAAGPHAESYVLVLLIQIVRLAAGPEWAPVAARTQMDALPTSLREELSGASVACGASNTAIQLPRAMLSSPLGAQPQAAGSPAGEISHWLDVLRNAIGTALPVAAPSIEWGSEISEMSPRTLQRRLQEHGLTWFQLVDQVRRATALQLLDDPGTRIRDVASAVGYANSANFTHAFHRWTGSSPSRYRRER